jgi:hypothetical protein
LNIKTASGYDVLNKKCGSDKRLKCVIRAKIIYEVYKTYIKKINLVGYDTLGKVLH